MYTGIIYKATSPSKKMYYGKSTRTLDLRKKEHRRDSLYENRHFCNAIKKYGINNFDWEILEKYTSESLDELTKILNSIEIKWIKYSKSHLRENGYNMSTGGEGAAGLKRTFSKEHRKKLSEAKKGKKLSEEHKRKISESEKGRVFSEETKKKISESKRGSKNPFYGKKLSADHRKKLSDAAKKYYSNKN